MNTPFQTDPELRPWAIYPVRGVIAENPFGFQSYLYAAAFSALDGTNDARLVSFPSQMLPPLDVHKYVEVPVVGGRPSGEIINVASAVALRAEEADILRIFTGAVGISWRYDVNPDGSATATVKRGVSNIAADRRNLQDPAELHRLQFADAPADLEVGGYLWPTFEGVPHLSVVLAGLRALAVQKTSSHN